MKSHVLGISALLGINSFCLNLRFNDQSELSTESEAAFQRFCTSPETKQYRDYAELLSQLPIMNGTVIDNCWFITAAHTFDAFSSFYGQDYVNKLSGEGILFHNNRLIIEKSIRHPQYDLILVKIKPVNLVPLERVRTNSIFLDTFRLEGTMFFSRTIHFGKPSDVNSIAPNVANPVDRPGYFTLLQRNGVDREFSRYITSNTLGVKVRSYTGDSGSPILNIPHIPSLTATETSWENKRPQLLGIAISMGGENINMIKVNHPQVNEWIDYTILTEALKT